VRTATSGRPGSSRVPYLYDLDTLRDLRRAVSTLPIDPLSVEILRRGWSDPPRAVAVLAGAFNPLTVAHLALARAALRRAGVDAVVLSVSRRTVDKEAVERASLVDRLLVLCRQVESAPRLGLALVAQGLYVDQALAYRRRLPRLQRLFFVVGFDKLVQILDGRYYADRDAALDRLFSHASLLVAPRDGGDERDVADLLRRPENRRYASAVRMLALGSSEARRCAAVSSSAVRAALAAGRRADEMLPPAARLFVRLTGAYDPPRRLPDGSVLDRYEVWRRLVAALLDRSREPPLDAAAFRSLHRVALAPTALGRAVRALLA